MNSISFHKTNALSRAEYIDHSENFISIQLEINRNKLYILDLILTIGSFILSGIAVMTGIFGQNLNNPYMSGITTNRHSAIGFCSVTFVECFGASCVLLIVITYIYRQRL